MKGATRRFLLSLQQQGSRDPTKQSACLKSYVTSRLINIKTDQYQRKKGIELTYTEAAAVADATLAKAEPTPQSPDPTALAAAADVTSAVNAVEFATGRAQDDPAHRLCALAFAKQLIKTAHYGCQS